MNRGPKFNKRSQLFIRVYNVTAFRRRDAHQQSRSFSRHDPAPKTATYSDCVAVLQRASQKRNSQSQPRNDSATRLLCNWRLNLFVFSDLRSRHTWWHAACIKRWYEHNQYYEQQIRIHLRPTSPVGRKKDRGVLEIAVYAAFILSVVFSILQFAQTPVTVPAPGTKPCVACHTTTSEFRAGT